MRNRKIQAGTKVPKDRLSTLRSPLCCFSFTNRLEKPRADRQKQQFKFNKEAGEISTLGSRVQMVRNTQNNNKKEFKSQTPKFPRKKSHRRNTKEAAKKITRKKMPAHNLLILLIWGQLTRPTNPQFRTLPALHLSQITHVDTLLKASQRERGEKKGFKDSDSILEDFQLLFVISFRGFRFCGLPKK